MKKFRFTEAQIVNILKLTFVYKCNLHKTPFCFFLKKNSTDKYFNVYQYFDI